MKPKKCWSAKPAIGPSCTQADINELMVNLARRGKRVVRLKSGDPMIFGRAAEEVAACTAANIAVEIVPGITAAQGAASRLGLSLTDRDHARRLQYVTGHAKNGALPADIDWHSLADPTATTAIYMPVGTLSALVGKAVAEGLDPATPAVAVARATRPDQEVIADLISNLPARLTAAKFKGPVVVLLGRAYANATVVTPHSGRSVREPEASSK